MVTSRSNKIQKFNQKSKTQISKPIYFNLKSNYTTQTIYIISAQ